MTRYESVKRFLISENFKDVGSFRYVYNAKTNNTKILVYLYQKVLVVKLFFFNETIMSKDIFINKNTKEVCNMIKNLKTVINYFEF